MRVMAESQNQKIDELLLKVKALGQRVKSTRDSFGQPVADRLLDRLNKLSSRLPQGDGESHNQQPQQPPQPEEAKISCPKCGVQAVQGVHFCSSCSFDFEAEKRRQQREQFEREKCERASRVGVVF